MSSPAQDALGTALSDRMARPQRHRLLQGYPAMPQMIRAAPSFGEISDGVRMLDGALLTDRATAAQTLATLRAELESPGPHWARTPESRARFEREVRPRLEQRVAWLKEELDTPDPGQPPFVSFDASRELIVGIIPHTQCTPKVEGCGFCTFPHDRGDNRSRGSTIDAVGAEITLLLEKHPALRDRKVAALYFGGGTANLARPEQLKELFETLQKSLRLEDAEVSLEGVPALFTSWFHAPMKMLAQLPVRQRRISMGIQTFDAQVIAAMGRSAFGDERTVTKLVARARSMGITTSGDFLFNLPGQKLPAMLDDLERAIASGLDQICLYNLVLYEGLGTLWSKDPQKLAAMPDNETACASWIALRAALLAAGFVQTTLTNFERKEIAESEKAFLYERLSFSPERADALGFGPMSLSAFVDPGARRAVKLQRGKNLLQRAFSGDDLHFQIEGDDLGLFFLTRSLAKGAVDRGAYQRFCASDITQDFPRTLALLEEKHLLALTPTHLALTPRGMFFSDAVVATFLLEKDRPRTGAGVHTHAALAAPTRVPSYDGMG